MTNIICRVTRGCTFCNTCIFECPVGAIAMTRTGAVIDESRCTGCGICIAHCASEAIQRIQRPDGQPGSGSYSSKGTTS